MSEITVTLFQFFEISESSRAWGASHFMMNSSKKEWASDEIKELIGAYKTRPALWDIPCNEHRNKKLKNEILIQFTETFQCTSQEIGRKLYSLWELFSWFSVFPIFFLHHTKCSTLLLVHVYLMNTQDKNISSFETALLTCSIKSIGHASESFRWGLILETLECDSVFSGGHALWKFCRHLFHSQISSGHQPLEGYLLNVNNLIMNFRFQCCRLFLVYFECIYFCSV